MTIEQDDRTVPTGPGEVGNRRSRHGIWRAGLAGAVLLAIGAGAGAAGYGMLHQGRPSFDADMPTTPVAELADGKQAELKGKVVEIFGNMFVVEDGTGRALVETGKAGEGGKLVASDETVTVQGRFDKGFVHASALQRADGSVDELRPLPPRPPHDGPRP